MKTCSKAFQENAESYHYSIAGLDPAIQPEIAAAIVLDGRVKHGHDPKGQVVSTQPGSAPAPQPAARRRNHHWFLRRRKSIAQAMLPDRHQRCHPAARPTPIRFAMRHRSGDVSPLPSGERPARAERRKMPENIDAAPGEGASTNAIVCAMPLTLTHSPRGRGKSPRGAGNHTRRREMQSVTPPSRNSSSARPSRCSCRTRRPFRASHRRTGSRSR